MLLVLDTNIVVSALLWGGIQEELLGYADKDDVQLVTSWSMIAELNDVLGRPKFSAQIHASGRSVHQLLAMYAVLTEVVQPIGVPRIAPDPDDDVVVGTALAARADYIVTGDRALLSVDEYADVRFVTARTMLDLLGPR